MSYFYTLEISDPRFECGGLRHITAKSKHLKGRGDITVYIPQGAEESKDLPIAILLHGVYGSHWAWAMKGGVHKTLQRLIDEGKVPPMVLAMPSDGLWGDGSGYLKHSWADYENWIIKDVPHALWECIDQVSEKSVQFIGGLSMGGYGAMRLGAKYGKQFRGISAHSSVTKLHYLTAFVSDDWKGYEFPEVESSVLETCIVYRETLPPLRFDCGIEDDLINANRNLHDRLLKADIGHVYQEFSGGHSWEYWEEHVEKSLIFFAQQL